MVPYEALFLFLLVSLSFAATTKHDFRYISHQDLHQSMHKFSQQDVVSYSGMLFDVARNQVLVGARDVLFRLSLPKLQLLEYAEWPSSKAKRTQCINKGQSDEFCHNYIKILLTNGKFLFACGTGAFSPRCTYRKIENISDVTEWVEGVAKCPYNPESNVTGFMSENGEYYFGGPTDFSGSDSLISKNVGTDITIRTKQYNSLWLNEPQFVGSFETENFVYFLFREAAVEYINCGKTIYSRIARVCKNDSGGHTMLKDNWTTFLKARLNCSISGEYPFYFDEIQSMSYVPDENIVYATFTTPINSIAGSAICAFNLTAIENAFGGAFKYQDHMGSAWGKHNVQHREHFECKSAQSSHLLETSKYQLMDSAVQATTLNPLHVAQLERFTHITIDVLSTKLHTSVHVIYVATIEGLIKKISVLPRTQETCVVEVWQTVSDAAIPINGIQFLKETNSIYVTTDQALLKIPADHCLRHTSKESCLNAMDPYCGWNERFETCSSAPNSDPLDKYWKQSVTSCPVLDAVVDGGWSSWSEWSPCSHRTSESDSSDTCLCQTRQCNNPAPENGGRSCLGQSIAVINCTVHGGWSDWSAWSACSASCGTAVKTRSRSCSNPTPAHGGRVCVGQDRTEAFCAEMQPCPISPQDGGWSDWTEWSSCSSHCGGGYKKRHRKCDSPSTANGGQFCPGNDLEIEHCNMHECGEHKKQLTTEWISETNTTVEYHRRRFRFICKAPVKQASLIKVSVKEEAKVCGNGGCSLEEPEHPRWSLWSNWGDCSSLCGGGQQNRSRHCENRGCQGPATQSRECNKHPCQGEWGCWSEWSPCNVSCGWGVKTRRRICLGTDCKGTDREEQPCEDVPCDSLLGWGNWTTWSLCDENKEQHRKRKCRTLNPGPTLCQGTDIETRMCINKSSEVGEQAKIESASVGMISVSFFVGLLIGLILGVVSTHSYHRKKKTRIPSSPHYISSKQNPYISMPLQERPQKKNGASTSSILLNSIHNGTLKSAKCNDYETATIKRNSHGLNNGHVKQEFLDDDKLYYD